MRGAAWLDELSVGVGAIPHIEGDAPQADNIREVSIKITMLRCMLIELYPLRLRMDELL